MDDNVSLYIMLARRGNAVSHGLLGKTPQDPTCLRQGGLPFLDGAIGFLIRA